MEKWGSGLVWDLNTFLAAERRKSLATAGRPWLSCAQYEEPQSGERIFRRYRGSDASLCSRPRPAGRG
jgi:hypothetical protein